MIDVPVLASRLIQLFEGLKLAAYWDYTGKVWTIGFGHTEGVEKGDVITLKEAHEFFKKDCAPLINLVAGRPVLEAAALVSFGYNCGNMALQRVISGNIKVSEEGFQAPGGALYGTTSNGQALPGLLARRRLEAALILLSRQGENK